jgi:hypothetical protein
MNFIDKQETKLFFGQRFGFMPVAVPSLAHMRLLTIPTEVASFVMTTALGAVIKRRVFALCLCTLMRESAFARATPTPSKL